MSASPLIAKKWNYYNDFDADVCAVLRELIKRGLVPDGVGHSGDLSGADSPQEKAIRLALEEIGFPLGHKSPARVGRLRGYGNAINPHQAAHFIRTTYHG